MLPNPETSIVCPLHEDFKERVERLGNSTEKEDDGIKKTVDEHGTRLTVLETNYALIISNQDFMKKIMSGVLIMFIIYIGLWLVKTLGYGV